MIAKIIAVTLFIALLLVFTVLSSLKKESPDSPQAPSENSETTQIPEENTENDTNEEKNPGQIKSKDYETIKAFVKLKRYDLLKEYMADNVLVRIESSGCCGYLEPNVATNELKYFANSAGDWSFDIDETLVSQLEEFSPAYYKDALIGVTSDKYSLAIKFNERGEITVLSISKDFTQLLEN